MCKMLFNNKKMYAMIYKLKMFVNFYDDYLLNVGLIMNCYESRLIFTQFIAYVVSEVHMLQLKKHDASSHVPKSNRLTRPSYGR